MRTDEREDRKSCLLSNGGGNAVWAGLWECQSQQQEAQQGAEGLLGRMQAKGIVGNYTGLERASNALIQQDIFIKKQGCWTGTKRASERETPADPRLLRIRLCAEISALCVAFCKVALLFWAVCMQRERQRQEDPDGQTSCCARRGWVCMSVAPSPLCPFTRGLQRGRTSATGSSYRPPELHTRILSSSILRLSQLSGKNSLTAAPYFTIFCSFT